MLPDFKKRGAASESRPALVCASRNATILDPEPPPCKPASRKPVQRAADIRGTWLLRPAVRALSGYEQRIFIMWKRDGKYIREIARNKGVPCRAIEDILREAA